MLFLVNILGNESCYWLIKNRTDILSLM